MGWALAVDACRKVGAARRIAGLGFRTSPITSAVPLIHGYGIRVYISPLQSDHFTDAETCEDGDIDHRSIGFRNEVDKKLKLLWSEVRLVLVTSLAWRQSDAVNGIGNQQAVVLCRAENAGQNISDLVYRLMAETRTRHS